VSKKNFEKRIPSSESLLHIHINHNNIEMIQVGCWNLII